MKKEKRIETPTLMVDGNLMIWENMMIQLTNVSCASEAPLEKMSFPKWSILVIVLGFWFCESNILICLLLIGVGIGWIVAWDRVNKEREQKQVLSIVMNSGDCYCFVFNNKKFLHRVMLTFKEIFKDNRTMDQKIFIDMKNAVIKGSLHMMNDNKFG